MFLFRVTHSTCAVPSQTALAVWQSGVWPDYCALEIHTRCQSDILFVVVVAHSVPRTNGVRGASVRRRAGVVRVESQFQTNGFERDVLSPFQAVETHQALSTHTWGAGPGGWEGSS